MQLRILMMALVLGTLASLPGRAGVAPQTECESTPIHLKLSAGDTLTGLFGSDWQKVWRCNQNTFMRSGRPIFSPDLVVTGQVLRVPASTRLTHAAVVRIEEIRTHREQLQKRLAKLESAASYPDAKPVIEECRRVLNNDQRFVTDLEYLTRQMDYLEGIVRRPPAPSVMNPFGWPRTIRWLGLVAICFIAGLGWLLRTRRMANQDVATRQLRSADSLMTVCRDAGIQLKL
jgi:hypothetical protein